MIEELYGIIHILNGIIQFKYINAVPLHCSCANMQKLIDKLFLLKSTFLISNQFLITFKNFVVLFNTGLRGNTNNILSSILYFGFNIYDLKYIFITHADGDHIGSLSELKIKIKAIVFTSFIEKKITIEKGGNIKRIEI